MADDKVPTADQAVERIVGQLKQMREHGATVPQQQGYLKSQLLSNKVVFPQDRTEVLKKVNHSIGTSWSMTKVKQADHTPFVEAKPKTNPIPVDELHGSSTVDMAASQDKGVTVKVIPDGEIPEDTGGVDAEIVIGGRRAADTEQSREATEVLEDKATNQDATKDGSADAGVTVKLADSAIAIMAGEKDRIIPPNGLAFKHQTLEEIVCRRQMQKLVDALDEGDSYLSWRTHDTHVDHLIQLANGDTLCISMNTEDQVIARENISQHRRDALANIQAANTHTNTQSEESNMQAQAQQTNTTTNAAEATAKESIAVNDFINMLTLRGAATPELRAAAFHEYIDTKSPATKQTFDLFAAVQPAEATSDQRIFAFLDADSNKAFTEGFMIWIMTDYTPHATLAEAKSRWSLMGDRDEGIRSSWIGAGAAVIGGGMEMVARGGGLTIGSGVGTLVGAGVAFFAGEMIDSNIESQFGRYVAAGTLGLGLGAAGSAVGRSLLPGRKLISAGVNSNDVDNNAPVQVLVPGASANLGLIAGL